MAQRLQEVGSPGQFLLGTLMPGAVPKLREVQDPLTWTYCFLSFMAARVEYQQAATVLGSSTEGAPGLSCALCLASDHNMAE